MSPPELAQFVCKACNVRKKACDKALPSCGYCAARKLPCHYDSNKKRYHPYNPGKKFVLVETLYPSNEPKIEEPIQHRNPSDSSPLPQRLLSVPSQSTDESVNQQVVDIIRHVGLSLDRISEQYFQTFHYWYPIISPELFYQAASQYHGVGIPPADFSILILAMCLITTVHDSSKPPKSPSSVQGCLYSNTKSLFALAQAALCTSLHLVQAAFLIAACEYICTRPQVAYISISTCSSLARVLGVTKEFLSRPVEDSRRTNGLVLKEIEMMNISWAIPMLERIILAEVNQKNIVPQSQYPDLDFLPPSDFPSIQSQDLRLFPDHNICDLSNSSNFQDTSICRFGWQAQAVSLLDQVLLATHSTSHCNTIALPQLTELDRKLRSFLTAAIEEENKKLTSTCLAVALCIRSLFLLHQHIIAALSTPQNEYDHCTKCFSQAAVDTACEMVVDAVRCASNQKEAGARPICCYYNLRCALQCLRQRQRSSGSETFSADVECLLSAEEAHHSKWTFQYSEN